MSCHLCYIYHSFHCIYIYICTVCVCVFTFYHIICVYVDIDSENVDMNMCVKYDVIWCVGYDIVDAIYIKTVCYSIM